MKTRILHTALFTPGPDGMWGLPLLLWGLPGVAKSAVLRQLARSNGLPIEILSPAARGEGAFGVTPVPENGRMTYPRPDWTDKFEHAKRGIVFVDEINLAATHYSGALLGLLGDRILGSYQFAPGVRILAAANPIDIAAASGGWDLSAPAANRIGHLDWPVPGIKAWSDWLFADGGDGGNEEVVDAASEEQRVMQAWPEAWAKARGAVSGYLSSNAPRLHSMPAGTSGAWPSPRTWAFAARALAGAIVHGLSEVEREELFGAFIGNADAGQFFGWYANANLPDSADLLDGKVKWQHSKTRLDVTVAVFGSAVAVCTSTTDELAKRRRAEAMWQLLCSVVDDAPDLAVQPARLLIKNKLFAGSTSALSKLKPLLVAAGIQAVAV